MQFETTIEVSLVFAMLGALSALTAETRRRLAGSAAPWSYPWVLIKSELIRRHRREGPCRN